jgi:IPT/TIG domain
MRAIREGMGGARRSRGAAVTHGIVALLLALLAALPASADAAKTLGGARYRVGRVCRVSAQPDRAACQAMKLIPASLSSAELRANALRQSREAAGGARPAVAVKIPYSGYLTPERLHAAYALPNATSASPLQTIALVDAFDDPTAEADLGVYDSQFGLPACTAANGCLRKVNESGAASPLPKKQGEWAGEISIDVQMAHAICPGCRILLVEASSEQFSDLGAAVNTAVALGASEVSNSYAATEQHADASLESSDYDHPGVLVAASSGDCGYDNKACAADPKGANFPADSPRVLAVGGTSLSEARGAWTSTVWEEGGSGCSKIFEVAAWQSSLPEFAQTGCASGRSIADVAAIGDPETGVDVYDSTPEGNGDPTGWGVWGGTSVSSPIVAAEYALAGGGAGVSYPSATLYAHLGQSSLYDVVSGSNGSCGGTSECKADTGYDGPTGVGSPLGLGAFAVPGAPASTAAPTIGGFAEIGQKLTAAPGHWSGSPTSTALQWARCDAEATGCAPIAGATSSAYTVLAADTGSTIRVQETVANASGQGAPAVSAPTAAIASDVPTISVFSPTSGITGSTFAIEGAALASVEEVKLGALTASFKVISPTLIEGVVPDGAKPGKVAVSAPGGSASTKAKFTPTFAITGFSPASAAPGRPVAIKGVGFTPSSTVAFGGVAAEGVEYVSAKKLKVRVPAGASSGAITVTNTVAPAGTVSSAEALAVS